MKKIRLNVYLHRRSNAITNNTFSSKWHAADDDNDVTNNCSIVHTDANGYNLMVVGKTSGVNKYMMENAAEIPNFPIMLNAVLTWTSDTLSPIDHETSRNSACYTGGTM